MTVYEVRAPDGRLMRQTHAVKPDLLPGYAVEGVVIGADANGHGGFVHREGGPSLMRQLLDVYGDELREWLKR